MDPTEQVMEGSTGRGRRASSRIQKLIEEPVVPGTQEEYDIPSKIVDDTSNAEDALDEPSEPKPVLPSEDSSMETSPYFTESTPQTSTRRLRPRTFRSPIKVPPLLLSKRVTRSASTTTPRARKQGNMATTNEETPEKSKSDKSSKTPKTASSKKAPKEKSEKSPKEASKSSSKTLAKTPSKTPSKTPAKTLAKATKPTSSEVPAKSSTRKSNASTANASSDSDLALKYGDDFDWEEYAKFCMRRTRLATDPSVTTVIENIRLYGNWKGENQTSSGKASGVSKKKQSATEASTAAANEPKEEKKRTKEERKIERELKKQRREERRRRKEEKKSKKERDGETKKKHRHKKKSQEEEEKEVGTDASSEGASLRDHQSSSSPEASGNTSTDSTQPTKSRKRKSDDSETPKPKKAKKSDPEVTEAENTTAVEEPKSTTKQRKSPAKQDVPSTALETVSESVLNLGSNSPSKRVPAGTSVIVPPPADAVSFGLIQEEVCHNPVGTAS
ncbi:hypothetical protein TWF506_006862 [Arthrobotrys conoides]|uniref:Uncharacterized protein n=1 Tax=Arthrobotrys conoides TaxID=74498 RepID=A0AAN8NS15_9PEZI